MVKRLDCRKCTRRVVSLNPGNWLIYAIHNDNLKLKKMGVLTFFLIFVSRPNAYFWASEVKHNFIKAFHTVMQDLKIKVGIFTTFLIFCFTSKCFFGLKKLGKLSLSQTQLLQSISDGKIFHKHLQIPVPTVLKFICKLICLGQKTNFCAHLTWDLIISQIFSASRRRCKLSHVDKIRKGQTS